MGIWLPGVAPDEEPGGFLLLALRVLLMLSSILRSVAVIELVRYAAAAELPVWFWSSAMSMIGPGWFLRIELPAAPILKNCLS